MAPIVIWLIDFNGLILDNKNKWTQSYTEIPRLNFT